MRSLTFFISYPIFLAAILSVPFIAQRLKYDEREAMGLSAIALIVFIPGTSRQYWILVAIFGLALLSKLGRWYSVFTLVTALTLIVIYLAFAKILSGDWNFAMNTVWLVCIGALIMIYLANRSLLPQSMTRTASPRKN
ncbi:MAG: hypothetical protein ABIQ44_14815 [Chloroflexia bacterium]